MQELLLVNPSHRMANPRRRRRRKNASAKQRAWRKKFGQMFGGGRRRANPKKRRKARFGGTMRSIARKGGGAVSRSSWRASGYRRNPRRRRYRRNPVGLGRFRLPTMTGITRTVTEAAQGAVGATLVDLAMGQMAMRNWLPQFAYTDMGYPLVKGALAIGTAAVAEYLIPRPFKGIATEMAKGSITITLAGVIRQFMPSTLPMGARRQFGYGSPGMIPSGRPRASMGEYLSASPGSMSMREMEAYGPGYSASSLGRTGEYLSN
jgi:hypothetical protein